jgi:hypothetical protein
LTRGERWLQGLTSPRQQPYFLRRGRGVVGWGGLEEQGRRLTGVDCGFEGDARLNITKAAARLTQVGEWVGEWGGLEILGLGFGGFMLQ